MPQNHLLLPPWLYVGVKAATSNFTHHWGRCLPGQGVLEQAVKGLGEEQPELVEALHCWLQ